MIAILMTSTEDASQVLGAVGLLPPERKETMVMTMTIKKREEKDKKKMKMLMKMIRK